jgi:nicotinate-nucleotide adenylyltransferase
MIGILGGTFDPIHNGHLRTALDVQQSLGLDEMRLIPLRDPPHKEQPTCSPEQRLKMLRAAVANEPSLTVDERELNQSGKSYSLLTIQSLRDELGDIPICLIIGQDAYQGFPTWHKPDEILQLAHLVIMQRPGEHERNPYPERITDNPEELRTTTAGKIYLQPVTQLNISSTGIREMIRDSRSPRYLLPDAVLEIIEKDDLYRT